MALPKYTFDELKKIAKSFLDRLPTATEDSVVNGWKMFALAYMNTDMDDLQRESAGPALFRVIEREYTTALVRFEK